MIKLRWTTQAVEDLEVIRNCAKSSNLRTELCTECAMRPWRSSPCSALLGSCLQYWETNGGIREVVFSGEETSAP